MTLLIPLFVGVAIGGTVVVVLTRWRARKQESARNQRILAETETRETTEGMIASQRMHP